MQQHRALILRGNRFLGSALVDKGLISQPDLEAANDKFMTSIQGSELKNSSILTSLLYDLKVLDENDLIAHTVEERGCGLIDLNHVELQSITSLDGVDPDLCWATSTIPFDKVEKTHLLASSYVLSAPVVKHWEQILDGTVIWYVATVTSISRGLETLDDIHRAEAEAAEEEEEN
ncbi:MAG: hypothetical protein AAF546_06580 [Verrucomicrobiota bacterium]